MGYFICSGEISATFVEKTTSTVFSIVMGLSLVLHVTIFIRIRLFRLRSRAETAPTSNNKSLFLKDVDGSNLANYTVHLVCILIFLVTLFCIHRSRWESWTTFQTTSAPTTSTSSRPPSQWTSSFCHFSIKIKSGNASKKKSPDCCICERLKIMEHWAVVVTQLVERSLPTSEVLGLNPVIGEIYI